LGASKVEQTPSEYIPKRWIIGLVRDGKSQMRQGAGGLALRFQQHPGHEIGGRVSGSLGEHIGTTAKRSVDVALSMELLCLAKGINNGLGHAPYSRALRLNLEVNPPTSPDNA
jgi:hypothetical protein